jgi:hypothetical protein
MKNQFPTSFKTIRDIVKKSLLEGHVSAAVVHFFIDHYSGLTENDLSDFFRILITREMTRVTLSTEARRKYAICYKLLLQMKFQIFGPERQR